MRRARSRFTIVSESSRAAVRTLVPGRTCPSRSLRQVPPRRPLVGDPRRTAGEIGLGLRSLGACAGPHGPSCRTSLTRSTARASEGMIVPTA